MLVVVGGHSRNIGKTSVMAGIIRALPEYGWTAAKITQYGHGICSSAGKECGCAVTDCEHPYAISEETTPGSRSDSSRFLAAGAARSFWIRTSAGQLAHALPMIRDLVSHAPNAIVESNSILEFVEPELYLVVLDPAVPDFKESSRKHLGRADALILSSAARQGSPWPGISDEMLASKPQFAVRPPGYTCPALVQFVRDRLERASM